MGSAVGQSDGALQGGVQQLRAKVHWRMPPCLCVLQHIEATRHSSPWPKHGGLLEQLSPALLIS